MIRNIGMAATAIVLSGTAVYAHDIAAPAKKAQMSVQQPINGECRNIAFAWNMNKIERTFRAMPQSTRKNIQHILRHADLYSGRDDGIWGPKTECAMSFVVGRFQGNMSDHDMIEFFEYMLDGGFIDEYPGTPNQNPHPGVLY